MKVKKVNELVGFGPDSEYHIPTRQETTLRNKIDQVLLYYKRNYTRIDLDEMRNILPTGSESYTNIYKEIVDVLKNSDN